MARHSNGGLSKRCDCARRAWTKCPHPWHFDFYRGRKYRFSLHVLAGKPPDYEMGKGEAEALRDLYRSQIRAGTFVNPNEPAPVIVPTVDTHLTFGDVVDRYLVRHVNEPSRREAARRTMRWHLGVLRRAEVPAAHGATIRLELKRMDEIGKADVEAIRDARRAAAQLAAENVEEKPRIRPGVKGGEVGINRILTRLRHVFSWAIAEGFVDSTPFKRHGVTVVKLASEAGRHRRLVPGEEEGLLAHAGDHLRALIIAALETGCRQGELLSLQWRNVEYEEDAKGQFIYRRLLLTASKTKTSQLRGIPITARLRAILDLRRHRPDAKPTDKPEDALFGPDACVFGNEVGEQIGSVKTAWRATCRRAGIADLKFHDLRREFACRLLESGADLHDVRDYLGHANITTTSRYLATSPVRLDRVRAQFEKHRNSHTLSQATDPAPAKSPEVTTANRLIN